MKYQYYAVQAKLIVDIPLVKTAIVWTDLDQIIES